MEIFSLIASGVTFLIGRFFGGKKAKKYIAIAYDATALIDTLIKGIEDEKITAEEIKELKLKLDILKETLKNK